MLNASRSLGAFALRASFGPNAFNNLGSSVLKRHYAVLYSQRYSSQEKRPTRFVELRVQQQELDPKNQTTFAKLGISPPLVEGLKSLGVEKPTSIQEITISALRRPANYAVASHTGSGKTLAYLLPLSEHLRAEVAAGFTPRPRRPRVLVLGPTKELTDQIGTSARRLQSFSGVASAVLNGGKRIRTQRVHTLQLPVDIAVATPTRLLELVRMKALMLDDVRWLVVDEADSMLAQGWREELEILLVQLKRRRDPRLFTLLASASWPREIRSIAKSIFPDVRVLETDTLHRAAPGSAHVFAPLGKAGDKKHLLEELVAPEAKRGRRILVFCNTLPCTRAVERFLSENGVASVSCNGAMPLDERKKALRAFTGEEFMENLIRRHRDEEKEVNRREMAEAGLFYASDSDDNDDDDDSDDGKDDDKDDVAVMNKDRSKENGMRSHDDTKENSHTGKVGDVHRDDAGAAINPSPNQPPQSAAPTVNDPQTTKAVGGDCNSNSRTESNDKLNSHSDSDDDDDDDDDNVVVLRKGCARSMPHVPGKPVAGHSVAARANAVAKAAQKAALAGSPRSRPNGNHDDDNDSDDDNDDDDDDGSDEDSDSFGGAKGVVGGKKNNGRVPPRNGEKEGSSGSVASAPSTPKWELRKKLAPQFEREFRPPVMVATDVAARGLDFDCRIDLVVNYDFPLNSIDYLHRTGRTARAGHSGKIISLVDRFDRTLAERIQNALKHDAPLDTISEDPYFIQRRERQQEEKVRKAAAAAAGGGKKLPGSGTSDEKGAENKQGGRTAGDANEKSNAGKESGSGSGQKVGPDAHPGAPSSSSSSSYSSSPGGGRGGSATGSTRTNGEGGSGSFSDSKPDRRRREGESFSVSEKGGPHSVARESLRSFAPGPPPPPLPVKPRPYSRQPKEKPEKRQEDENGWN